MSGKSPTPPRTAHVSMPAASQRANLIPVRPPGESQKTLKKDAEKMMKETEPDERRRVALMQFMQRELSRLGDKRQQAEEAQTEAPALEDYYKPGATIATRFKIIRKLQGGAFGRVYSAWDEAMDGGWVAVKIESLKCPTPLLYLETTVLRSVRGESRWAPFPARPFQPPFDRPHSPMYVAAGRIGDDYNYSAMQLLGPDLDTLRRRCPLPVKRYSISTAMRLSIQCLEGIRDMHSLGWVHRDIKASNFAIGGSKWTAGVVYLLDYGLCREHLVGGKVRPERKTAGFRGTVRYASKSTHCMQDLGRKNDLWSLFYTIAEWLNGGPPWGNEADAEIVYQIEKTTPLEQLAPKIPELTLIVGGYLEGLKYADAPDYQMIEKTLRNVCEAKRVRFTDKFDWDNDYEMVKHE